ncbi:hypothetical protein Pryu01_03084 [Paraliobacillus ryukyuensis]|uniref:Peptidoglycan/xylan/chitin deacetylase (PgdA/CDA1 family) n=1 Tax=Paraliobacillus ryukyuensis TaxID=200904 RepID=A0A366DRY9_9BACI|nr:polysaccharide deacetylase family protein [Paraliobacillus ryukyuensis]RBO92034.1 peptidoglycan/xylan/chitin deacetylase (PgdA/CDA1 family) [Paraliobacillus ryukyuensis]
MKSRLLLLLFISFILLLATGCGNTSDSTEKNDEGTSNEQKRSDNDSAEKEVETKSSEEKDNETSKQDKEEETEAPEPEKKEATYQINPKTSSVEPLSEDGNEKVVLLTIDDAPDQYALEMAKTLKEIDAHAIFFVNGHFLNTEEQKNVLKQIYEMGFMIGNHTMTHQNLTKVNQDKQYEEIVPLNDLIEEVTGERPKFFRAPHGANTDYSRQLAKEEGMVVMNWTYGYDYFAPYQDAEKLTKAMVSGEGPEAGVDYSLLKSGANLLMHDRDWTNKALKDIVMGLRDKGYETVDPHAIKTIE